MKTNLTPDIFLRSRIPVWVYGFPTVGKSTVIQKLWDLRSKDPRFSELIPDDSDSWFAWSTYQWDTPEGRPVLCEYAKNLCTLRGSPRVIFTNLWWLEPKVSEVHFLAWILPKDPEIAQARARARGSSESFVQAIPNWLTSVNKYISEHSQIRPIYLGPNDYASDALGM
jgi:hypothetical protein